MKSDSVYKISYWIRIINLESQAAEELKTMFPPEAYEVGKFFKDSDRRVLSLKYARELNYDILINFLKKFGIPETDYGLYVSLISSDTSTGIEIPLEVVHLYRKIGGTIDISISTGE
jgi:hypothetical protein